VALRDGLAVQERLNGYNLFQELSTLPFKDTVGYVVLVQNLEEGSLHAAGFPAASGRAIPPVVASATHCACSPMRGRVLPTTIAPFLGVIAQLGVILYMCVTGKVPFDAENPLAVISMQVTDEPPPLREAAGSLYLLRSTSNLPQ
jgi:hypothetical protein